MILKLQRSLGDGGATVLAYNKHRTVIQQFPCTKDVAELFDECGQEKIYVRAHIDRKIIKIDDIFSLEALDW